MTNNSRCTTSCISKLYQIDRDSANSGWGRREDFRRAAGDAETKRKNKTIVHSRITILTSKINREQITLPNRAKRAPRENGSSVIKIKIQQRIRREEQKNRNGFHQRNTRSN